MKNLPYELKWRFKKMLEKGDISRRVKNNAVDLLVKQVRRRSKESQAAKG